MTNCTDASFTDMPRILCSLLPGFTLLQVWGGWHGSRCSGVESPAYNVSQSLPCQCIDNCSSIVNSVGSSNMSPKCKLRYRRTLLCKLRYRHTLLALNACNIKVQQIRTDSLLKSLTIEDICVILLDIGMLWHQRWCSRRNLISTKV